MSTDEIIPNIGHDRLRGGYRSEKAFIEGHKVHHISHMQ